MTAARRPIVHHIPVCPFSQRMEILLELKGCRDAVEFRVVDITRPRPPELLALTRGLSALPVLQTDDGTVLRESLVVLRYLDERFAAHPVAQADPLRRAVENLLATHERDFGNQGYALLMNRDPVRRTALHEALLAQYARLDDFLRQYGDSGPWLFECFGWAETVFAPLFMRFWFLDYYEGWALPADAAFDRVRSWVQACVTHPAAQQVCREEIVKLYADYAQGAGNGALPAGRQRSSFVFEPGWRQRPWPPRDKYGAVPGDAELGLLSAG